MDKIIAWIFDYLLDYLALVVFGGALILYFLFNPERISKRDKTTILSPVHELKLFRHKHTRLISIIISSALAIFGLFSFYLNRLIDGVYLSWFGAMVILLALFIVGIAVPLTKNAILLANTDGLTAYNALSGESLFIPWSEVEGLGQWEWPNITVKNLSFRLASDLCLYIKIKNSYPLPYRIRGAHKKGSELYFPTVSTSVSYACEVLIELWDRSEGDWKGGS